jgi:hypothetical protein
MENINPIDGKKKRGRKPKNLTEKIECNEPETLRKKRGRKPKFVYSTQDNNVEQGASISDDENIIVRLNVVDEANADISHKIEEHPYAYNADEYTHLSNFNELQSDVNKQDVIANSESNDLKVINLLQDFEEKNKVNEWPSNTSICCYWCCHKFENAPFGIPVNYSNGKFDVFGCFCSLECASAYNFKMHDNIDEMWERYNLINLLYRKINKGVLVKPAPDRLVLKMFGGFMDIKEFRETYKSNKLLNVNFPPMTSLTQQIEEINEHELNNDFRYIPLDQDRVEKYKAKIFKRNKPLINNKNSLESSMNLKYS